MKATENIRIDNDNDDDDDEHDDDNDDDHLFLENGWLKKTFNLIPSSDY